MWDEVTYPFPNFNGATVEVWEWISNFSPHLIMDIITYPCRDKNQTMLVKGGTGLLPFVIFFLQIDSRWRIWKKYWCANNTKLAIDWVLVLFIKKFSVVIQNRFCCIIRYIIDFATIILLRQSKWNISYAWYKPNKKQPTISIVDNILPLPTVLPPINYAWHVDDLPTSCGRCMITVVEMSC